MFILTDAVCRVHRSQGDWQLYLSSGRGAEYSYIVIIDKLRLSARLCTSVLNKEGPEVEFIIAESSPER